MSVKIETFVDGYAILGDSTTREVLDCIKSLVDPVGLIVCDPPYGNVLKTRWDRTGKTQEQYAAWMLDWTHMWAEILTEGGAFYVWGGIGTKGFRPFMRYLSDIESHGQLNIANLITWSKKRGYGVQNNYLFTREECVYLVKGNPKAPRIFNVPFQDKLRGYAGYNKKYPAHDARLRRTNVWTDITEIFRNKTHPAQKTQRLLEIPIEVHTNPGEYVIDPFAGSGATAFAARALGRKFIVIENDESSFNEIVRKLT